MAFIYLLIVYGKEGVVGVVGVFALLRVGRTERWSQCGLFGDGCWLTDECDGRLLLVWAVYAGLDLGELPLALRGVEVGGYFAAAVDNCGVVAVS